MVCFICIVIILPLNLTAQEGTVGNVALTNYGRTTIANIFNNNNITDPALLRLYVIAFCTWYITYFALRNIERDWKENLVLRRVYYLESDHYGLNGTTTQQYTRTSANGHNNTRLHERALRRQVGTNDDDDDGSEVNKNNGVNNNEVDSRTVLQVEEDESFTKIYNKYRNHYQTQ